MGATLGESSRKVSSSSLQIPGGLLRRSNSDGAGSSPRCCHQDDSAAAKKVTFSQVKNQELQNSFISLKN